MKINTLTIFIAKTPAEIFNFTLNPANTALWVDSIVKEETNEWPVKKGSVYRNMNSKGEWSEYTLCAFEQGKIFELVAKDGNYHVRYTLTSTQKGTNLEYTEWVERGELTEPFTKEQLEKLKKLV